MENKNMVKNLLKIEKLNCVIYKLYVCEKLTNEESEYLLSVALILLNYFNNDENNKMYFELAYFIILKYSILKNDYRPLSYVSYNYGFYPIYRYIMNNNLLENASINDVIFDSSLDKFVHEGYVETNEQYNSRNLILKYDGDSCYVAPTSSGKSSLVVDILKCSNFIGKAIIVVPSKSLLYQTYSMVRSKIFDRRIICHNEMYNNEKKFVAVLTQERTLRLFEDNLNLSVDCLFIDEAHNLFSNDVRNVLLARVIKRALDRNENTRIIYLSPFINDALNLTPLCNTKSVINEQRINYNIKEPNIFELRRDGKKYQYNRFFDIFYELNGNYSVFEYINKFSKNKKFYFLRTPKKIEKFAWELYQHTEPICENENIIELKKILKKYVHENFAIIDLLNHGIIYMHAKIPDIIKSYLEYQFKINDSIRYIIANSVILEGINLPIDCLFILDAHSQNSNQLNNLIGRVNRLNYVFGSNGTLSKLLPDIHYVNSDYYRYRMENKIKGLYKVVKDEITNPLLEKYDIEKIKGSGEKKKKVLEKNEIILNNEELLYVTADDEHILLKQKLIKSGMDQLISLEDSNITKLNNKIKIYKNSSEILPIIDLIKFLLIDDIVVINKEFKRLENDAAVRYYKTFLALSRKEGLNTLIKKTIHLL